jgi:hypothetical protein
MPQVGFEPTIPVFEQAKTFHALDHAATVISVVRIDTENCIPYCYILYYSSKYVVAT